MKYFFVIIFVFFIFNLSAQDKSDFRTIESRLSVNNNMKNWDKVIEIGKEAISKGLDYYYLRYYTGVAYFEKGEYRHATLEFEKAYTFNSFDNTMLEYLYYSYVFSGRATDARALALKLATSLKEKLNIHNIVLIESINIEGGYQFSNTQTVDGKRRNSLLKPGDIYAETDLNKNISYAHLGIRHLLGGRLSIYQSFSSINIQKEKHISAIEYLDTTIIPVSTDTLSSISKYSLSQKEYYVTADIYITKGLKLSPAYHFINVSYPMFLSRIISMPSKDVAYEIIRRDTSFNNYVLSLSLTKELQNFSISPFFTYSNLNNKNQWQEGIMLTYYPQGNLDLYATITLTNLSKENKNNLIIQPSAGVKLLPKLWSEVFASFGDMSDFNEKNAFIVYNISDKINFRTGLSLILPVSKNFEFTLRYQYIQKQNSILTINPADGYHMHNKNYMLQSIIGGIKIKL